MTDHRMSAKVAHFASVGAIVVAAVTVSLVLWLLLVVVLLPTGVGPSN